MKEQHIGVTKSSIACCVLVFGKKYCNEFYYGQRGILGLYSTTGKCRIVYNDTECEYEGEIVNDQFYGTGRFVYSDGETYEGEWEEGKRNGVGVYTFSDGTQKRGIWESGELVEWIE